MAEMVSEIMSRDPATVSARAPISAAALMMRERDIGDVLVTDEGRLRGVLTDRDIVVRAVADSRPTGTTAEEICSEHLITCQATDDVNRAVALMREHAVRRLPVVEGNQLVGMVSLGDLARDLDQGSVLAGISAARPNT